MSVLSTIGATALQVLRTVAPTLATAVGGPFGALATPIINAIFGLPANATVAASTAAITAATPDQLLALKQAEDNFQVQMKQLGISEEALTFTDLASARSMQVSTKDPNVARLAWLIIGGFMAMSAGVVIALLHSPTAGDAILKGEAGLFFGTLFGYLASEAKQASAFYFGSTAAGQVKDATIADIAKS